MHRLATVHARDNQPTINDVTTQPISISCAATWPPQYAPAPWPWLLTF